LVHAEISVFAIDFVFAAAKPDPIFISTKYFVTEIQHFSARRVKNAGAKTFQNATQM
jgi:hypothetical protein